MSSKQIIKGDDNFQINGNIIINTQDLTSQIDFGKKLLDDEMPESAYRFYIDLKNRVWNLEFTTSKDKYRILANLGSSKFQMNLYKEAAEYFIEAYQYNRDDEKAKLNYALAYHLLGDDSTCLVWVDEVLKINPINDDAYALLIVSSSREQDIDILKSKIPDILKSNHKILFNLGLCYSSNSNYSEAINMMNEAILAENDNAEYNALLAGVYLQENLSKEFLTGFAQLKIDNAEKALYFINKAINKYEKKEIIKYRHYYYLHRGGALQYLKDIEGAIRDTERALEMQPNDYITINNLAMLYKSNNQLQKAIELLEKNNQADFENRNLLLAEFYRMDDNSNRAIELLDDFISICDNQKLVLEAKKLLATNYQIIGDNDKAEKINNEIFKLDEDDILTLLNQAEICEKKGDKKVVIETLMLAYNKVNENTNIRYISILVELLYKNELINEAKALYEKISDIKTSQPSFGQTNKKLLNCYIRLELYTEAFEMCQILKKRYPYDASIIEIEAYIYEKGGDLCQAENIYVDYLKKNPSDININIRLSLLRLRKGKDEKIVDVFLDSNIDYSQLDIKLSLTLAQLFYIREKTYKLLELLYETRRKYFNSSEVHTQYFWYFMESGDKLNYLMKNDSVGIDTVVKLKNGSETRLFIIEKRKDADRSKREIAVDSELAKKLLGKKLNDFVELTENRINKDEWEIIEIKSKYLYALHEIMNEHNEIFPEDKAIQKIVFDPNKNIKELLDKMFEGESERKKTIEMMNKLYLEGKLTLGIISNFLKRNYFEIFGYFANDPQIGIIVSNGSQEEIEHANANINKCNNIILDLSAIHTLNILELTTEKLKLQNKFKISQCIKDEINEVLINNKGMTSNGYFSIGLEKNEYFREDVTKERVGNFIKYLKKIQKWIDENCEIVVLNTDMLTLESKYKNANFDLGNTSLQSILISKQLDGLLCSDDYSLRSFARGEFKVKGIWSQIYLLHMFNDNRISKHEYLQWLIKLISYNYKYLPINIEILLEAADLAKWSPVSPFDRVVFGLKGNQESAYIVARITVDFISHLWLKILSIERKNAMLFLLLESIMNGRDMNKMRDILRYFLEIKFRLQPFQLYEIEDMINKWYKIHIH